MGERLAHAGDTVNKLVAISAFVGIVENKSFQEAGKRLGLSRSAVTKAIKGLEDELGVKLFYRNPRAVNVTAQGLAFFKRCAPVLKALEEAESSLKDENQIARGTVRVAMPHALSRHVVPALPRFFSQYPEIEIDLRLIDADVDLLRGGYDVWITARSDQLGQLGLKRRYVGRTPQAIAASPGYLRIRGTPRVPQELAQHNCILPLGWDPKWRFRNPDGSTVAVEAHGNLIVSNGQAMVTAVAADIGIARASLTLLNEYFATGQFVRLLEDYAAGYRSLSIIYPNDPHLPMKTRLLIDFLAKHIRSLRAENS